MRLDERPWPARRRMSCFQCMEADLGRGAPALMFPGVTDALSHQATVESRCQLSTINHYFSVHFGRERGSAPPSVT